ncbi:pseudouridine synthase [Natronohydrobacter thiooxidans]|uniref:pseudouridine synthase n=1 Tax=Natronohydrobacter thiooxidans TaxID=87172 RepID=UPI0008FF3F7E|nr:pseudouridine synthase [Natronohydrobacter thiooxidans]
MSGFIYTPPAGDPVILHEDHELVFVDKPSGLLSVPGKGEHMADCMIARLRAVFPEILLVHRLDLDTSGVMVFARTPHAQRHLGLQFEKRQTRKIYVARVAGQVAGREGRVDLPLIVDWPNRPRQMVCHETGRPAQTDWALIRQDADESRLRLMPVTGRSHQLRVHMLAIGHPILGDPLYATGAALAHPRLMLHAQSLRLRHPDGGKGLTISAPVPF